MKNMTHTTCVIIQTFLKAQDFDLSGFQINVSTLFINIKTQEPYINMQSKTQASKE
jgi:hypothetical protein